MPIDPFRKARKKEGVLVCPFQGEEIPMILRHADVRVAAKNWEVFSSDAPFRVPIPSEEKVRTMRQLPIETDPPEHGDWRKLVEPFFLRAKLPEVIANVECLIRSVLESCLDKEFDAVRDLAIPVQSRALTHLLNVPESEAEIYIKWGMHVFSGEGDSLEAYLHSAFDAAEERPGEDFFSELTRATFRGRALTREEMMGLANLTFAGGRDTVIHTLVNILAHFSEYPDDLAQLSDSPKSLILAGEEFFRAFMPLTHIGRVCPESTEVAGHFVPAGGRVSLGWAAANFDDEVFSDPEKVKLDRKPNPHVSFGFGAHLCLGAHHARLIVRSFLTELVARNLKVEVVEAVPHLEHNLSYTRKNGFDRLIVRFI